MYLDQYNVITLEYFYYSNDCKYSYLSPQEEYIDENNNLVDNNGEKVTHLLGTEKYLNDPESVHPMNQFDRDELVNYSDSCVDLIK